MRASIWSDFFSLSNRKFIKEKLHFVYSHSRDNWHNWNVYIHWGKNDWFERKKKLFVYVNCVYASILWVYSLCNAINCWQLFAMVLLCCICKQIKMQNEFESRTLILIPMFNFKHVCNKLYMQTYQVQMIGDTLQFFVYEIEL